MTELYIPTIHSFAMNNIFTGSCASFRFRVKPEVVKASQKEVDLQKSTLIAEFWHGPFCYEKSTMEGKEIFPMTEDGRAAMKKWLEAHI